MILQTLIAKSVNVFFTHQNIYFFIFGPGRYLIDDLKFISQGNFGYFYITQESIIKAAPKTNPMAEQIKSDAGDNNQIEFRNCNFSKPIFRRFQDPERALF